MRLWIYLGLMVIFSPVVIATELVHRAVNPNFGGNPLNGNFIMSQATAQDTNKDPSLVDTSTTNPIQDFTDNLKSAVLNNMANSISNRLVDANGNIIQNRQLSIGGFSISVGTPNNGSVNINISDGISDTQLTVDSQLTTNTPVFNNVTPNSTTCVPGVTC